MRRNTRKQLPEFPVPGILIDPATIQALKELIANADKNAISEVIYKGKFKDPDTGSDRFAVREQLMEIYHNKCAYCEDIEAKPDVEHYRPKKGVTGEPDHPGYYWLCYEWTNLIPACRFCNAEGGKWNKFPIRGIRCPGPIFNNLGEAELATHLGNHLTLVDEMPYLLHPELDTPDDGSYFKFGNNGSIEGIDLIGRGARTIQVCDLDRQTLRLRRQKMVVDEILKVIRIAIKLYFEEAQIDLRAFDRMLELIFEEIQNRTQPDQPLSLFALYTYEHFDEMIIPLLSTSDQQEALSLAFEHFKNNQS